MDSKNIKCLFLLPFLPEIHASRLEYPLKSGTLKEDEAA